MGARISRKCRAKGMRRSSSRGVCGNAAKGETVESKRPILYRTCRWGRAVSGDANPTARGCRTGDLRDQQGASPLRDEARQGEEVCRCDLHSLLLAVIREALIS